MVFVPKCTHTHNSAYKAYQCFHWNRGGDINIFNNYGGGYGWGGYCVSGFKGGFGLGIGLGVANLFMGGLNMLGGWLGGGMSGLFGGFGGYSGLSGLGGGSYSRISSDDSTCHCSHRSSSRRRSRDVNNDNNDNKANNNTNVKKDKDNPKFSDFTSKITALTADNIETEYPKLKKEIEEAKEAADDLHKESDLKTYDNLLTLLDLRKDNLENGNGTTKDADYDAINTIGSKVAELVNKDPKDITQAEVDALNKALNEYKYLDDIDNEKNKVHIDTYLTMLKGVKPGKAAEVKDDDNDDKGIKKDTIKIGDTDYNIDDIDLPTINELTYTELDGIKKDDAIAILKNLDLVDTEGFGIPIANNWRVMMLFKKSELYVKMEHREKSPDQYIIGKVTDVEVHEASETDPKRQVKYTIDCKDCDRSTKKGKYRFTSLEGDYNKFKAKDAGENSTYTVNESIVLEVPDGGKGSLENKDPNEVLVKEKEEEKES